MKRTPSAILLPALTLAAVLPATAGRVCFEAENAESIEGPMEQLEAGNEGILQEAEREALKQASGNAFIRIAQGKGNPPEVTSGEAVYTFTVEAAGDYVLWCRAWWDDACGNSFTMQIDDGPPFTFGGGRTFKTWHWERIRARIPQLRLSAGNHTLRVKNREDGVALDQVLLTSDPRFVPIDVEPVSQ